MAYSNTNINKHIYLRAIHDNNETLFFKLVQNHLAEMMPIIYTPTVGDACEQFSDIYRSSRGLFISYEDRFNIDDMLRNATKNKEQKQVDRLSKKSAPKINRPNFRPLK